MIYPALKANRSNAEISGCKHNANDYQQRR